MSPSGSSCRSELSGKGGGEEHRQRSQEAAARRPRKGIFKVEMRRPGCCERSPTLLTRGSIPEKNQFLLTVRAWKAGKVQWEKGNKELEEELHGTTCHVGSLTIPLL